MPFPDLPSRFLEPSHVGPSHSAPRSGRGFGGSRQEGALTRISLALDLQGRVESARFKAQANPWAIARADLACEWARGQDVAAWDGGDLRAHALWLSWLASARAALDWEPEQLAKSLSVDDALAGALSAARGAWESEI